MIWRSFYHAAAAGTTECRVKIVFVDFACLHWAVSIERCMHGYLFHLQPTEMIELSNRATKDRRAEIQNKPYVPMSRNGKKDFQGHEPCHFVRKTASNRA
jgi:hypothetical protein